MGKDQRGKNHGLDVRRNKKVKQLREHPFQSASRRSASKGRKR